MTQSYVVKFMSKVKVKKTDEKRDEFKDKFAEFRKTPKFQTTAALDPGDNFDKDRLVKELREAYEMQRKKDRQEKLKSLRED